MYQSTAYFFIPEVAIWIDKLNDEDEDGFPFGKYNPQELAQDLQQMPAFDRYSIFVYIFTWYTIHLPMDGGTVAALDVFDQMCVLSNQLFLQVQTNH